MLSGTYGVASSGFSRSPLSIHTEYLPNSDAAGVLYGVFNVGDNGIDFTKSIYLVLRRNNSISYVLPFGLQDGVYYVHAYTIEQDGLLKSGETFPATSEIFSQTGNSQGIYKSLPGCVYTVKNGVYINTHGVFINTQTSLTEKAYINIHVVLW